MVRCRKVHRLLVNTSLAVLLGILGTPGLHATSQSGPPYEVARTQGAEVLRLGWYGGMRPLTARYRLFGDGRLLREVVRQADPTEAVRTDGVSLDEDDVTFLFDVVVHTGLATATSEELLEATDGVALSHPLDGATAVLDVSIARYETPEGVESPFTRRIVIPSPDYQAKRFPQVRAFSGLLDLHTALDSYFPQTVDEAVHEVEDRR